MIGFNLKNYRFEIRTPKDIIAGRVCFTLTKVADGKISDTNIHILPKVRHQLWGKGPTELWANTVISDFGLGPLVLISYNKDV